MTDLHTRLRAAIEEKLDLAKAATPGPWNNNDVIGRDGVFASAVGHYIADCRYEAMGPFAVHNASFIAAHDPAAMIRLHEAALERLDEHTYRVQDDCCEYCLDNFDQYPTYPCVEIRGLAAAYGVPADTEEADRG